MKQKSKDKTQTTSIKLSAQEIRNIMSEYEPDILRDNEQLYNMKVAMKKLDKSDAIILALYSELQSERKVAEILGVSRSPIHKILTEIKNKVLENGANTLVGLEK